MLTRMQNYQKFESKDVRVIGKRTHDGVESQLLVLRTSFRYRRAAELFRPEGEDSYAAILYVHWYEPESHDSNRSQFVEEAIELAKAGAICLTVETLWSDPDFFLKRRVSVETVETVCRFLFLESTDSILDCLRPVIGMPAIDSQRTPVGRDLFHVEEDQTVCGEDPLGLHSPRPSREGRVRPVRARDLPRVRGDLFTLPAFV